VYIEKGQAAICNTGSLICFRSFKYTC